ncbi:MAG TPA: cytochrome c oxidase assembly protein, partial [Gemmatimonadales bacterium]|nr:cytochrome c oxidase assembly protein [Gemmatimonadales bacterium]
SVAVTMESPAVVWNAWHFEPGIVAALGSLAVAYALAAGRFRKALLRLGGPPPAWLPPGALSPERPGRLTAWQAAAFYAGIVVAAVSLLSPLHALGEQYLLSAHMVQHLLLTLVVPPLLLLGTPGWMLRPLLRRPPLRDLARNLLAPIPAFLLFNAVFLLWHVPAVYELSLRFAPLHALEHVAFGGLALLTWWPVFGPVPEFPRLPYGAQVVYLFFQSLPPTVLGAIIALAERPIYATYWAAPRLIPGLEPLADQQAGGLIMWIPGALGYFLVLSVVFFLWMEVRGQAADPPYRSINPDRARTRRAPNSEAKANAQP